MLRSGELVGRRISARGWMVDPASVAERARIATEGGRPWTEHRVRSVIEALSSGEATDGRTRALIRATESDALWRKLAQPVMVRRFSARHPDIVRESLVLTGESAIDVIGGRLVGQPNVVHGYLREGGLDDLIDDAGLVEHSDGAVAIHAFRSGYQSWIAGNQAPPALVAVDCARSAASRVRSIGIGALEEMRQSWLTRNT